MSYKCPEAVRAASGRRNPFCTDGAVRTSTEILWPMAGGLGRMSRRLGAKGLRAVAERFLPPGLGS